MLEVSPQRAAQELLKRRSIRVSLTDWAQYKGFEPAKHHQLIIEEIESFLDSDDEVLLLFAPQLPYPRIVKPPRAGHSKLAENITVSVPAPVSPVFGQT